MFYFSKLNRVHDLITPDFSHFLPFWEEYCEHQQKSVYIELVPFPEHFHHFDI